MMVEGCHRNRKGFEFFSPFDAAMWTFGNSPFPYRGKTGSAVSPPSLCVFPSSLVRPLRKTPTMSSTNLQLHSGMTTVQYLQSRLDDCALCVAIRPSFPSKALQKNHRFGGFLAAYFSGPAQEWPALARAAPLGFGVGIRDGNGAPIGLLPTRAHMRVSDSSWRKQNEGRPLRSALRAHWTRRRAPRGRRCS